MLLVSLTKQWRPSIVRVHATYNGNTTVGTGFYIDQNTIMTCAHVVLGQNNLKKFVDESTPYDNEVFLLDHFKSIEKLVVLDDQNKSISVQMSTVKINGATDVALLNVQQEGIPIPLDSTRHDLGEDIYVLGYPTTIQISDTQTPFAAYKGNIMSEGMWQIGGYKTRPMLKLYCPALGGVSGSPIFSSKGECFAMLHGQMHWGDDNFLFREKGEDGVDNTVKDAFHVPLPFGFGAVLEDIRII